MALSKGRISKLIDQSAGSFSQRLRLFSSGRGDPSNFNDNTTPRNPPDPIPNRPLRGERPSRRQSPPPPRPPATTKTGRYDNLSDDAFLDKFKLGLNKNKDNDATSVISHNNDVSIKNNDTSEKDVQASVEGAGGGLPPPDADEIFKKMKETGLIPNAVAMLDGLCKDGLVQEAMKLFGLMREKGTIPEVVIYTAVVEGFCKAQKLDDAKRIFKKMQDNGIVPNAFSYTVLIQGLYKCNYLDDAVDFCVQMLDAGHSPNVVTFVGLIDGLCREKGVEEARSVITLMQQKGFFVNEKGVREFLDKKGAFSSLVWEAVFGKKTVKQPF